MTNILTAQQAANAVRVDPTDLRLLDLLPQVDLFITRATGRDWTQDTTKHLIAISAATMLLVQWYDDPGQIDSGKYTIPPFGLAAALGALEAEALRYRKSEFRGISGIGYVHLAGAKFGDQVIQLRGVYGVTGDQSSSFDSTIRYDDSLHQITTADCFWNRYVIVLKSPGDDIQI